MSGDRKLPNRFNFRTYSLEEVEELRLASERANRIIDAIQRVVPMDTPFHLRRALLESKPKPKKP